MNDPKRRWLFKLMLSSGALLTWGRALAADFPKKTVEIVVGFPAGGSADMLARVVQPVLAQELVGIVIVENRPGAATNIATGDVARAQPDGHRLLLAVSNSLTINPHLYPNAGFDVLKDLRPLAIVATAPLSIAVRADSDIASLADLLKKARAEGGKISYGSPGIGSPMHLLGEILSQEAKVAMTHVPYSGTPPLLNDLVGGNVTSAISTYAAMNPFLKAGKLRILALAEDKRFELAPDIPLIKETVPGISLGTWFGFAAPAKTPDDVIERLHRALFVAMADAKVKKTLEANGMVTMLEGPQEMGKRMRAELDTFGQLIKSRGIEAK
jgi:tripartite-type tricarboxylate transporter receptor subunit TctC